MFQDLLQHYEEVRQQYEQQIVQRMDAAHYREYCEILFSTHSCAIEGNSFTLEDSKALKELGLGMVPHGRKLQECVEMADHFSAYEYVMSHLTEPLTEDFVREVNRRLVEHTLSYVAPDSIPGQYTDTDMAAGDTVFGDHELLIARMPSLLESTERSLQEGRVHPLIVAARFHGFYEYLHPFRDGNGRTGRLLSNYILCRSGHPQLVIRLEERQQYIAALRQIRTENTDEHLIAFFIKTATRHMEEELAQKRNNTRPRLFLF
ncbi:MAG: Fic family protein [Bacteroidaceae bacterium]|nr:Fic family protein [Bacteroidaceae bacterium]